MKRLNGGKRIGREFFFPDPEWVSFETIQWLSHSLPSLVFTSVGASS